MTRTCAILFAAALLITVAPALAAAPAPPLPAFLLAAPAAGCASAVAPAALAAPAAVSGLDAVLANTFHGFCRCSCSTVRSCNTSADCGGAPCLSIVTCCPSA